MTHTAMLYISQPHKNLIRITGNEDGFVNFCAELLNMAYGESPLGWDTLVADEGAGLDKGSISCLIYRVPDSEARSRHSAQTSKNRPPSGDGVFLRIDPDIHYTLRLSGSTDGFIRLSMMILDSTLRQINSIIKITDQDELDANSLDLEIEFINTNPINDAS